MEAVRAIVYYTLGLRKIPIPSLYVPFGTSENSFLYVALWTVENSELPPLENML